METIVTFLETNGNLVLTVVFVVIIMILALNAKLRNLAMKYIPLVEDSSITDTFKASTLKLMRKLEDSDMDERLIEVIVAIVQAVPVLRIIPKTVLVKFLKRVVQTTFNKMKPALDVNKKSVYLTSAVPTKHAAKITEEEIASYLGETFDSLSDKLLNITNENLVKVTNELHKIKDYNFISHDDIVNIINMVEEMKK